MDPIKIGYTRVSTVDQNPELQIKTIADAGIPSDYIFVDRGISGTIPAEKRPGFRRAMQCIEDHKATVKFLYVYEISRIGRNTLDTINTIAGLEKGGVMVYSLSPSEQFMQVSDPSIRQFLLMVFSWVAQRERDHLSDRTRDGLDVARASGKILGRPRAIIDFEQVAQLRKEGKTWDEVADAIGVPILTLYRARKRKGDVEEMI